MKSMKRVWAAVVALLTLLSLFAVARELEGLQDSADAWRRWLAPLDTLSLFKIYSAISTAVIVAILIGPLWRQFWDRRSSPLRLDYRALRFTTDIDIDGPSQLWMLPIKNTAKAKTIRGVQVKLLRVTQVKPDNYRCHENELLSVHNTGQTTFDIAPMMTEQVTLVKRTNTATNIPQPKSWLVFGPFKSDQTSSHPEGLYKIDVAISGTDIPTQFESLAIRWDATVVDVVKWTGDHRWPFVGGTLEAIQAEVDKLNRQELITALEYERRITEAATR